MAMWWGLISTQRLAQKLISGPSATAKSQVTVLYQGTVQDCYWPPYWTQHTEKTSLLNGADRQSLKYELLDRGATLSPCSQCEALATPRHAYLGSLFSEPENVSSLGLGAIWNFIEGAEFP